MRVPTPRQCYQPLPRWLQMVGVFCVNSHPFVGIQCLHCQSVFFGRMASELAAEHRCKRRPRVTQERE